MPKFLKISKIYNFYDKKDIFHFILNVFEPDFHMTCSKSRIFSQTNFYPNRNLILFKYFTAKVPEV